MLAIVYALEIGAVIGCLLKLASPHRHVSSWIFASMVGSLGALIGVFVSRLLAISEHRTVALHLVEGACAFAVVLAYAVVSRLVYRPARLEHAGKVTRLTRPTILF